MLLWIAAALSALWALVHIFWGGKDVAAPLKADVQLDPVVRVTMLMCWHFVSASLILMAVGFGLTALGYNSGYAAMSTTMAYAFWITGAGYQIIAKVKISQLPQGWLFLPVALLGTTALMG